MDIGCEKKSGIFSGTCFGLKGFRNKLLDKFVQFVRLTKKVGGEDPRRVIHSLKVGFALTLVSFFYYLTPLYRNFGVSAMWAVMTVVVVLEFSVGGTVGKGINRGIATLLAGALGLGVHHLASLTGKVGEPILTGTFVFLQAVVSTFIRFFPKVKARYDYGLLIFNLTFCLVSISGLRADEILELAHKRLSTVFIGASTCVIVSIFICPVWSGQDLHNLVADHIEKLGNFMEGFGEEYFAMVTGETGLKNDKTFLVGYISVLNSKATEESLANLARWEPGHGKFRYLHPWQYYLKTGNKARQCARRMEALSSYLNPETKTRVEIRRIIQDPCTKMCRESGQALKELSLEIRKMRVSSSPMSHIKNSKMAAQNLKSLLKSDSWDDANLLQVMPVAAVASLLIDVAVNVEEIAESVNELASMAKFETCDQIFMGSSCQGDCKLQIQTNVGCSDRVIIIPVTVSVDSPTTDKW